MILNCVYLVQCSKGGNSVRSVAQPRLGNPDPIVGRDEGHQPLIASNGVRLKNEARCVGENFINADGSRQTFPIEKTYDPREFAQISSRDPLTAAGENLRTTINVEVVRATLELKDREANRVLYSISQEPFHGFVQGSLTQGEAGGEVQCESNLEPLKQLIPTPKICGGYWYGSSLARNDIEDFIIDKDMTAQSSVVQNDQFELLYEISDHFILVQLVSPMNKKVLASGKVDRYFKNATMNFFIQTAQVTLECDEEVN